MMGDGELNRQTDTLVALLVIYQFKRNIHFNVFEKIGMIERDEVDIGVTDFYANNERAEVSDFSVILDYAP